MFYKLIYYLYFRYYDSLKKRFNNKITLIHIHKKAGAIGSNFAMGLGSKVRGISRNIIFKNNVQTNGISFMGAGKVTIGNYFHSGEEVVILTSNHNFRNAEAIPYDRKLNIGDVVIEDFVWLGHGVIILPGVTLGEGCIVGAGSVVTKSVDPLAIVAGNPARKIGERNSEEFFRLKQEGKFH